MTAAPTSPLPPAAATADAVESPHSSSAELVASRLGTSVAQGLTDDDAAARIADHGPNELAEVARRLGILRFLDQFRDLLIGILLAAAVVSFAVSGELKTPIVVLVVVLLNAILGFVQENRAEASLEALRTMLSPVTKVRRGGDVQSVASRDLVPGDVVLLEAGDRVPADGACSEHVLEIGLLERIVPLLVHDRLARCGSQLVDDAPPVGVARQLGVVVLHPHHRHLRRTGPVDEPGYARDRAVAVVRAGDDVALHVHDEERSARASRERRHDSNLPTAAKPMGRTMVAVS
jgi:hypothetical protein